MRFKYHISICDNSDANEMRTMAGSFPINREYVYEIIKNIISFAAEENLRDELVTLADYLERPETPLDNAQCRAIIHKLRQLLTTEYKE